MTSTSKNTEVIDWLMQGDVSIQWQTMRDLLELPESKWRPVQRRVAKDGWGKQLLDRRDAKGTWGGGIYTPKWTSTTYTLLLLRQMGLPRKTAEAEQGARLIADNELGLPERKDFERRLDNLDLCITGMDLSLLTTFAPTDGRIRAIVECLLRRQMADGGWNCASDGTTPHHSSLHTTVNVLEGLSDYAIYGGKKAAAVAADAMRRGREFILEHRLYKSDKTGEVIHPRFTQLFFPPRWHWDVLRGLDWLREVNAPRDKRAADAIDLLLSKCLPDGRWNLENHHKRVEFFRMEKVGQPSRWNTLRAMRVLRWWSTSPFHSMTAVSSKKSHG